MPSEKTFTSPRPASDGALPSMFTQPLWDASNWFMMLPQCQASFARTLLQHRQEALAFAGLRCNEDLKLADKLLATKNINDGFAAWTDFLKDASAQYGSHVSKLAELTSTGTMDAVRNVQKEAESMVQVADLPKAA